FNSAYSRAMTEGERIDEYMRSYYLLCNLHEFIRLLESSEQTSAVRNATRRLESVFDGMLGDVSKEVEFDKFRIIDCNTLARVQLGSGLIVLNALFAGGQAKSPVVGGRQ